jgi:hypothetical protein
MEKTIFGFGIVLTGETLRKMGNVYNHLLFFVNHHTFFRKRSAWLEIAETFINFGDDFVRAATF